MVAVEGRIVNKLILVAKSDRGPSPAAPSADMSGGSSITTKQA